MRVHEAVEYYVRHFVCEYVHALDTERRFVKYLLKLPNVDLQELTTTHILEWREAIARPHAPLANRCLKDLRAIYNRMIKLELYDGPNRARMVDMLKLKKREVVMTEHDSPKLLAAIRKEQPLIQLYMHSAIIWGPRRNELRRMQDTHLNLEHGIWRIPTTKNGRAHLLMMPPKLLERYRSCAIHSPYVFSTDGQAPWACSTIEKYWSRVRLRAGLEHLWLHDLRRTMISELCNEGKGDHAQNIANHISRQTTESYHVRGPNRFQAEILAEREARILQCEQV